MSIEENSCMWDHHEYEEDSKDCDCCGAVLRCGPFYHRVCLECDASYLNNCEVCGQENIYCSC